MNIDDALDDCAVELAHVPNDTYTCGCGTPEGRTQVGAVVARARTAPRSLCLAAQHASPICASPLALRPILAGPRRPLHELTPRDREPHDRLYG